MINIKEGDIVTHKDYRPYKMVVVRVNQNGTIRCSWEDEDTGHIGEEDFPIEELRRLGPEEEDVLE